MGDWHHDRRTDIALRLGGAGAWAVAWLAFRTLAQLRLTPAPTPLAYALAAIGFFAVSIGGILLTYGHHLFDRVAVSARWATLHVPPPPDEDG